MWPWVWDVLDRIDDPNLLKIDGSTTNPQNFASFLDGSAFEGSQLDVHLTLSLRLVRKLPRRHVPYATLGYQVRSSVVFLGSGLLSSQHLENLKIYQSATLSLIQLVCHGSCGVLVCIFILVYLHHNEIFHMNGAHEPFLFANSLEGWDTAQFDSNKFLLLVEKIRVISMLCTHPFSELFGIFLTRKKTVKFAKCPLLMT